MRSANGNKQNKIERNLPQHCISESTLLNKNKLHSHLQNCTSKNTHKNKNKDL